MKRGSFHLQVCFIKRKNWIRCSKNFPSSPGQRGLYTTRQVTPSTPQNTRRTATLTKKRPEKQLKKAKKKLYAHNSVPGRKRKALPSSTHKNIPPHPASCGPRPRLPPGCPRRKASYPCRCHLRCPSRTRRRRASRTRECADPSRSGGTEQNGIGTRCHVMCPAVCDMMVKTWRGILRSWQGLSFRQQPTRLFLRKRVGRSTENGYLISVLIGSGCLR